MGFVIHHPAAPIECCALACTQGHSVVEPDLGLGLGQGLAQGPLQRQRLIQRTLRRITGKVNQVGRHAAGLGGSGLPGVGIHLVGARLVFIVHQP